MKEPGYFAWTGCMPTEAAAFFEENGYVVLTGHSSAAEAEVLRAAAGDIIARFKREGSGGGGAFATGKKQEEVMSWDLLSDSADKVTCFTEATDAAFVNKIGHALHDESAPFRDFTYQPRVKRVAEALGYAHAQVVQSMYILKGARVGGVVQPHRDSEFLHGGTGRCLGYWWALEDATPSNGCLWAVPGSHRDGVGRCFERTGEGNEMRFVGEERVAYAADAYVPLSVRCGDLVLLDGALIHKSEHNTSARSRHAYSVHCVEDGVKASCWLQRERFNYL